MATVRELRQQAKARKIKGYSKMNKAGLMSALGVSEDKKSKSVTSKKKASSRFETSKTSKAIALAIAKKTGGNAGEVEANLKKKVQAAISKKRKQLKKEGNEPTQKDLRSAAIQAVKATIGDTVKKSKKASTKEAKATEGNKTALEDLAKHIKQTASTPQLQMAHGMSRAEKMWSFEHRGIRFHGSGEIDANHPIVRTFAEFSPRDLPQELTKHTTDIFMTGQENDKDEYWRKKYKGFTTSAATGGDGSIVIYNSRPLERDVIAHEMGHNLAKARYGSLTPPPTSDYAKAMTKAPAVSKYAENSPSEDFAEALRTYAKDPGTLKKMAPDRFAVVDRLIKDPSYHG